MKPIYHM